jgi:DNA repair protein RadC
MADAEDAAGHRDRLRAKMVAGRGEGLADYELLEFLLMLARPRVDTKPAAKALLRRFGSVGAVMAASPETLTQVEGVGEAAVSALYAARATAIELLREAVDGRPVLASWQALIDYLRAELAHLNVEQVRVLHLNSKNILIGSELMFEGTLDASQVHIREVVRRAFDLGSAAIILVHNHPSGDPAPSRADIQLTRDIAEVGKRLGIAVHDHIIIAQSGYTSLRAQGLV